MSAKETLPQLTTYGQILLNPPQVKFKPSLGTIRRDELACIVTALYQLADDKQREGIEAIAIAAGIEVIRDGQTITS